MIMKFFKTIGIVVSILVLIAGIIGAYSWNKSKAASPFLKEIVPIFSEWNPTKITQYVARIFEVSF